MRRWNRWLVCGSLCVVLGAGLAACKKDEEAEDYGDNAATTEEATTMDTGMMGTEPMGTEMGTDMGTEAGTESPPP